MDRADPTRPELDCEAPHEPVDGALGRGVRGAAFARGQRVGRREEHDGAVAGRFEVRERRLDEERAGAHVDGVDGVPPLGRERVDGTTALA